jgi:hypothetical protein
MAVSTIDSSGLTSPLSATNLGTPSALVLTNATGLPTAGLVDASVTNAKLANGYPNQDYATPVGLSYQNLGTGNTSYNLGSISIPSAGIWRVYTHCRWGSPSVNMFVWTKLSTSTSSAGNFTNARMNMENVQASSGNYNMGMFSEWLIQMGTGISYPYTLYLNAQQGNNSGTVFLQNDLNGYNTFAAIKIASTTSTASAPSQVGV